MGKLEIFQDNEYSVVASWEGESSKAQPLEYLLRDPAAAVPGLNHGFEVFYSEKFSYVVVLIDIALLLQWTVKKLN